MKHTFKRISALLLTVAIIAVSIPSWTMLAIAAVPGYLKEIDHKDAAPEGYTPVFSREDLLNIKNDLTANYILMNDIDMFYDTISPIGKYEILTSGETRDTAKAEAFSGIFDGNGYAIENLDIMYTNTATAAEGYIGLFGLVSGEVKNLTVTGAITATSTQSLYTGGIVGYLYEEGKISNCTASLEVVGTTTGTDRIVGGIVGYAQGTVEYCSFSGNVSSNKYAGGIVGYSKVGTVSHCYNSGAIAATCTSNSSAGGIVGYTPSGASVSIDNCHNIGTVESSTSAGSGANAGGIVGAGTVTIENCSNSGSISSKAYHNDDLSLDSWAGGAAGALAENSRVSYFFNVGDVYSESKEINADNRIFTGSGGVAGAVKTAIIENVYNAGSITSYANCDDYSGYVAYDGYATIRAAGIIAWLNGDYGSSSIKNAYSVGTLSVSGWASDGTTNMTAALVCQASCTKNPLTVTNCYWPSSSGYKDIHTASGSITKTRVEALDDAQMLLQESFKGFPFGYKWTMGGSADYAYPEIAGMPHSTVGATCSCGTWGEWTLLDAATCEFEGTEYADCTTCGARKFRETAKAAHTFGDWTEQMYGSCLIKVHTCSVCGFVETEGGASNGHKASDPIVVPATCTERGKIYTTCTSCGTILSEEFIPKKGHTTNDTVIPATCEDYGYTEHKCADCGITTYDSYTLPVGHTWSGYLPYLPGEGYALIGRRTCTVCGATEDADRLPIIRVEDAYIPAGNEVEVNILIENNTGFAGVIFELYFDTNVLELVEAPVLKLGASAAAVSPIDKYEGRIDFVYGATVDNITGDGILATVTFKVKEGTALGSTPITVSVRQDSSFCYADKTEVDIPMVGVAGKVNIIERIKGDINGDRVVDNRDAARLMQYLTGWDVFVVTASLDTNGDGEQNIRDAALLMQYLAGYDVELH